MWRTKKALQALLANWEQCSEDEKREVIKEEIARLEVEEELMDTALELMEVYESVERTYRAAVLAGSVHPTLAKSTNF